MNSQRFKKGRRAGAAEGGSKILIRSLFYFAIAFFAFQFAPAALGQGLSTVGDYANRINQAKHVIDEVIKLESPVPELVARMNAIKRLLPESEEVEFNASVIRVDNVWLREAVNNVIKDAGGDIEQRHSMLREISDRLAKLQQSVKEAQTTQDRTLQDQRARLDNILARSEYLPEEKREPLVQRWGRKIKDFIFNLLGKLFGGPSIAGSTGLGTVFLILVLLVAIATLVFGTARFAQRLQRRKGPEEEAETREALGEEIAEGTTAADLFAKASELASRGDYRKAIRQAYIALLCDLEQRGKLRLNRSKTNRDYLDAMRSESHMYPAFSVMTSAFEHVWYGHERATEEEFQDFVALYHETVR